MPRKSAQSKIATAADLRSSPEWFSWIGELKRRYRATQIKAAVSVNASLLEFYWDLGRDISERYPGKKRDAEFFKTLSADLRLAIPEANGLSPTTIKYTRYFYELYSGLGYRQQLVDDNCGAYELMRSVPDGFKSQLPTIEEIEAELANMEEREGISAPSSAPRRKAATPPRERKTR